MKEYIKSVGALTVICGVLAVILAITNSITTAVIAENEAAAATEALRMVMPEGEGFEEIDISSYTLPSTVTTAYKESGGAYVVQLLTTGYGSGMSIMCGVDATGTNALMDMLDELRQIYDLSILMTTHDFAMLPRYADNVVLIDHAVIEHGSPDDVLNSEGFRRVFHRKGGI